MNKNSSAFLSAQDASMVSDVCPWFSAYGNNVPRTISYRNVALYTYLDEAAEQTPEAPACRFFSTTLTYAELREQAETIAANLRARGVSRGDRVGIMLPNLPQTLSAFWGVLKAGAVVVMINPLYMEKELTHLTHDAGIKHLISVDVCWPKLEKFRHLLGVTHFYITKAADGLRFPYTVLSQLKSWKEKSRLHVPFDGRAVIPFSDLLQGKARLSMPIEDPQNTTALLQYTGGTTGRSKGVVLTHMNLVANMQQTAGLLHTLKPNSEVIMAVLPLFHVYGLNTCMLLPTLLRACVVTVPRFSPSELLGTIEKYKVSVLPGAPSLYITLLQHKRSKSHALDSLKLCISGSAPMPVEYVRQFNEQFSALIIEGYGLSEASPITHLNPVDSGKQKVGTIGVPLPDTLARIVDMELGSVTMPAGKIGELVIKGPQVMQGYWNNPDETANTLRNGWLYTGDIATMDEDGYCTIVDRKKDMIIVGGFNVSPREIDEVLFEHPKIKEAVSVGVSHATRGEIIKAYVVLKEGMVMDRTEVVAWCRERLASFKIPRQVEFRDELPKSFVGKILRRTLREEEDQKGPAEACDDDMLAAEQPVFDGEGVPAAVHDEGENK